MTGRIAFALWAAGAFLFGQDLKNVQVLPFTTKSSLVDYMKKQVSPALGVKCVHCHNLLDYPSDVKEHKKIAREMMKMTQAINDSVMAPLKYDPVTCWTCHHGDTYPLRSATDQKKTEPHKHGDAK